MRAAWQRFARLRERTPFTSSNVPGKRIRLVAEPSKDSPWTRLAILKPDCATINARRGFLDRFALQHAGCSPAPCCGVDRHRDFRRRPDLRTPTVQQPGLRRP